jgi:hypothetical protein
MNTNWSLLKKSYHLLSDEELLRKGGEPEALLQRGLRLCIGIGTHLNEAEGLKLVGEAAKAGHPVGIAGCYFFGQDVESDYATAVMYYRQAADRGHPVGAFAHALHTLAR